MHYFKAFNLIVKSPIPLRGLIPVPRQAFDIEVVFEKLYDLPDLEPTLVKRKGLTASFGTYQADHSDCVMVWEDQISFRLISGRIMMVDTQNVDNDFLSLFIVSEPLGILLHQRGFILLHASAVKMPDNTAMVFMGEPGMGKSTTCAAFVKAGCALLSDDLVAIQNVNDVPYLLPSFPQLKIWKRSVDGLNFSYDEVEKIVEGTNKYAYYDEDSFENEPVILRKVYILGEDVSGLVDKIYTPIEFLKYTALPDQLLQKGPKLKAHFEKCIGFAYEIQIIKKPKMNDFDELKNFVANQLQ